MATGCHIGFLEVFQATWLQGFITETSRKGSQGCFIRFWRIEMFVFFYLGCLGGFSCCDVLWSHRPSFILHTHFSLHASSCCEYRLLLKHRGVLSRDFVIDSLRHGAIMMIIFAVLFFFLLANSACSGNQMCWFRFVVGILVIVDVYNSTKHYTVW